MYNGLKRSWFHQFGDYLALDAENGAFLSDTKIEYTRVGTSALIATKEGGAVIDYGASEGFYTEPPTNSNSLLSKFHDRESFTLFAIGQKTSAGTENTHPLVFRSNGSAGPSYALGLRVTGGVHKAYFSCGNFYLDVNTTSATNARLFRLVAVADKTMNKLRIYTDEGGYNSSAYNPPTTYSYDGTSARAFGIGIFTSSGSGNNGRMTVRGAVFNSPLDHEGALKLVMSSNYPIFEPKQIFIPAYQRADSILVPPVLSNPSVSDITTTTALPSVKVEF